MVQTVKASEFRYVQYRTYLLLFANTLEKLERAKTGDFRDLLDSGLRTSVWTMIDHMMIDDVVK